MYNAYIHCCIDIYICIHRYKHIYIYIYTFTGTRIHYVFQTVGPFPMNHDIHYTSNNNTALYIHICIYIYIKIFLYSIGTTIHYVFQTVGPFPQFLRKGISNTITGGINALLPLIPTPTW
jgi:hypothetical protein